MERPAPHKDTSWKQQLRYNDGYFILKKKPQLEKQQMPARSSPPPTSHNGLFFKNNDTFSIQRSF